MAALMRQGATSPAELKEPSGISLAGRTAEKGLRCPWLGMQRLSSVTSVELGTERGSPKRMGDGRE